ncbi:MAG TPA: hypothetical protein PKY82_21180 [Pyrinomonadaceae bacterium]|nr:hypothetical protein [Pyrinomonadaceae bacterium]
MGEIFRFFEPFPDDASASEYRIVSIDHLKPTKCTETLGANGRAESVEKALRHIHKLKLGVSGAKRRAPLEVKDNYDGTYLILDGNAAYSAYKELGWKQLPVRILQDD